MEEAAQGQAQAEVSESTRRVPAGAKCCDRLLFGKRVLHANSGAGMPCYAVENACTIMRCCCLSRGCLDVRWYAQV
jgi:hypothetical protein